MASENRTVKDERAVRQLALQMFDLTKLSWLRSQREKLRGGYDLSESEFLTLDALEDVDSLSVGQLRRLVGVLPSQMSRIIKALEQRYDEKLVLCSINSQDKRRIDVSITPRGRRAIAAYRQAKIQMMTASLRALSAKDFDAFSRIMGRMGTAVEADQPAAPTPPPGEPGP